jgi:hypothetical protein
MDNSTHIHPFERDDYPFPGQCVAIINPKSEAKAKRCGKVASVYVANLFPVCGRHREYLDAEAFSAAANGTIMAQADVIEELEGDVRRERGSAAEWRRLALAKHGETAREAYKPVLARDSFVYFVQGGDYIKIGKADNPAYRFSRLQFGGVIMPEGVKPSEIKMVGLERGGHERERELHGIFAGSRVAGEWFHADESLVQYIRALPEISSPQWGELVRFEPVYSTRFDRSATA